MNKTVKLRKGKDILLVGEAAKKMVDTAASKTYALKPGDFKGLVPRLILREGAELKAGTPVYTAKHDERICFCAPVSGELIEINRGARRVIQDVRILADENLQYESFGAFDPSSTPEEVIKEKLLASGCWPLLVQRPFGVLANPDEKPRDIFISGFDSSPLAPDYVFTLEDDKEAFQAGVNVLIRLTSGKVYLGIKKQNEGSWLNQISGVQTYTVDGPHPAGNVGVQIHHIAPINKGDIVWTIQPADVVIIGRLALKGIYDARKTVAITGSEVIDPAYTEVISGACLTEVLQGRVKDGKNRFISGNVLTGVKTDAQGYLGAQHYQITVIPEGDEPEFLGWLIPNYPRPSFSKTFPYFLSPKKKFKVNTSMHGEHRAFVVTGEYEKLLPMDILPVHLLKAVLAKDFEAMENLGIYEVIEEDLALCEFACTSKMEVQQIISDGLDLMIQEG